jgi:hypothetical protein
LKTSYARGNNKYIKDSANYATWQTLANNNYEKLGTKVTLHLLLILQMIKIRRIGFNKAR